MTKRKSQALTPDNLDCVSAWAVSRGIKDNAKLSMRGDPKAFALKTFETALPDIKYCWTFVDAPYRADGTGTQNIVSGKFPGKRNVIAKFNLSDLRQELSADNFALFNEVYAALLEQSRLAHYAVSVAKMALGLAKGRSLGGKEKAKLQKIDTANKDAEISAAAIKLLKNNPHLSDSDIARHLADRDDTKYGKASTIRKKLPRLLASVTRAKKLGGR